MAAGVTTMYNTLTVDDADQPDIAAALGGDEAAFARLIRRHEAAVGALMWRFTRSAADRDELVQDAFVEAYFGLRRFRGEAPFGHWLKRIATRVGYRFWKRRSRRPAAAALAAIDLPAPAEDPEPGAAGAAAHALLARLPPKERLVLTLMYFDNCSVREIAVRMGWTRGMVKMRAFRARRRLRAVARRERLSEKLGWTS
ncbi:MAG: RNA polymerase sigma factor [Planctomycetes bacterium]|nr:RNA polymerase sigma factor [Planctomycetota bacterium]